MWKTSSRLGVRFVSPLQSLLRYTSLSNTHTHTPEHVIYIKGGRDLNVECQLGASGQPVPPCPSVVLQIADPGVSRQGCAQLPSRRKNSLNDLDEIFIKAICHFSRARSRRELVLALSETWETNPTLRLVSGCF